MNSASLASAAKRSKLGKDLDGAFRRGVTTAAVEFPCESRVLQGIWAAAPYLHNGSVRSLEELLNRVGKRTVSFPVGPEYDVKAVGIADSQPRFSSTMNTTDCNQRDSGNSRCGHEFGVDLKPPDKLALLEYLKTL